jgi:hypothetical protein
VRLRLIDVERQGRPLDPMDHPAGGAVAIFRTCARTLTFLDEEGDAAGDAVVEDGAAYARLVEIVCGLNSAMVGETQVQGQFKSFLESLTSPAQQWIRRLGQQVLADARVIRETHLRGLGSRTYGSAVRRHAHDCARVAIIGAGALAQEIGQYVAETHAVDVWTRARLLGPRGSAASGTTVLVVAAPVDSATTAGVAAAYSTLVRIVDLRAADEATPLPAGVAVLTLSELFAEARAAEGAARKVQAARHAAAGCGHRYDRREELHPFGWEDLCA